MVPRDPDYPDVVAANTISASERRFKPLYPTTRDWGRVGAQRFELPKRFLMPFDPLVCESTRFSIRRRDHLHRRQSPSGERKGPRSSSSSRSTPAACRPCLDTRTRRRKTTGAKCHSARRHHDLRRRGRWHHWRMRHRDPRNTMPPPSPSFAHCPGRNGRRLPSLLRHGRIGRPGRRTVLPRQNAESRRR